MEAIKGVMGLFDNVNKVDGNGVQNIEEVDEYESNYSEQEIIDLKRNWIKEYSAYYADIEKAQKTSLEYWLGKQKTDNGLDMVEGRSYVVNKLFEAVETFIPIATRANPEPLVSSDNSEEGQQLAKDVKQMLVTLADKQILRRKLARMTRNWTIYLTGVMEVDYDIEIDEIKTTVINPKRIIFDKDGQIGEDALFKGDYLGVRTKVSASKLIQMFPKKKSDILNLCKGKLGTKLEYIKWWYKGLDVFFTLDDLVLGKFKNPHWNYDGEETRKDDMGNDIVEIIQGTNHFERPTSPYVFLSVFNTGLHPHDDTSLILQNIAIQDQINKRYRQLDRNIDSQNNGIVVDGRFMTKEQASEAASALRRGASIMVQGNPNEVISRPQVPQLPSDVWNAVRSAEQNLSNIFGTSGSTPSGMKSEETARGKIMVNQMDASRIGGGVTEYIEQVADTIYNLWVQMMFVHYDNEHYSENVGEQDGGELMGLSRGRFVKSLRVTVKEGTLVPKDPLTQRNEAIDLWSANAIDPLNLYKKLDFPDPKGATQSLILWQMLQKGVIQPEQYLSTFQIEQAQPTGLPGEQPGTGGPAINDLGGTEAPVEPAPAGTQTAGAIQSQELMNSVPLQ